MHYIILFVKGNIYFATFTWIQDKCIRINMSLNSEYGKPKSCFSDERNDLIWKKYFNATNEINSPRRQYPHFAPAADEIHRFGN